MRKCYMADNATQHLVVAAQEWQKWVSFQDADQWFIDVANLNIELDFVLRRSFCIILKSVFINIVFKIVGES